MGCYLEKEIYSLLMVIASLSHRLYLDDGVCERVCDDTEQLGGILARLDVEGFNDEVSEFVQDACGNFQG